MAIRPLALCTHLGWARRGALRRRTVLRARSTRRFIRVLSRRAVALAASNLGFPELRKQGTQGTVEG